MNVARIPPERIVIIGQSLGTAVASAVALRFADPANSLLPPVSKPADVEAEPLLNDISAAITSSNRGPTTFAGIVLVAPFSSLPSLMLTYRLSGVVPLLAPLRPFPFITKPVLSRMVDQWPTAERLGAYYNTLAADAELLNGEGDRRMGSLQILHTRSDMDISWRQTQMIVEKVLGQDGDTVDASNGSTFLEVTESAKPAVRVEIGEYGGES